MPACDGSGPPRSRSRTVTPTPSPTKAAERETPRLVIEATGRVAVRLATAIRDLKTVDLWSRLTEHLYRVELDSRAGVANVPEDGHLADAYFTGIVDEQGGGVVCDVMFFPEAIAEDLGRWRTYYAAGRVAEAPPRLREFYGALVAHELAHCRVGPRGEPVARAWERRALAALRAAEI